MEFETSSFDDMLHDLHIDNLLVTMLLATFAPLLIRTIIYFFSVTWPNFIHFLIVKLILRREVLGAPMNLDKTEETCQKCIHNDFLVHILLTYVSHRLQERHSLLQHKLSVWLIENSRREPNSLEQQKIITSAVIKKNNLAPPLFAQLQLKPFPFTSHNSAKYYKMQNEEVLQKDKRYKLNNFELSSIRTEEQSKLEHNNIQGEKEKGQEELESSKNKSELQRESSVTDNRLSVEGSNWSCNKMRKITPGVNSVLRNILLNEYTVSTLPASGIAVEVEPGLFVRYIESKTSWNKFIHHSLSGTHNENSGAGDGNNDNQGKNTISKLNAKSKHKRAMERGATIRETYLLYDLLQKLRFWPRGHCSNNKPNNAASGNNLFNSAGPFGNNVEDSWWSRMFNVNFAWNSFLLGWLGVNGNDGSDNNENWTEDDNDDDEDEVRALEEEQKQGYIARQIMIESVRFQPVLVQTDGHHPMLQSLWRATPLPLLYACFLALYRICDFTYTAITQWYHSETLMTNKQNKVINKTCNSNSGESNINGNSVLHEKINILSKYHKDIRNEQKLPSKQCWRSRLISWLHDDRKSKHTTEQIIKEKRRECRKETLARIDQFVDDAIAWYKENCADKPKRHKICYLIYPVLRPPPSLLQRLLLGNPFMLSSFEGLPVGSAVGIAPGMRCVGKMENESYEYNMGDNYHDGGGGEFAMLKRTQHINVMKNANNAYDGHGDNYNNNKGNNNNNNDDINDANGDMDSENDKSHSGKSDKSDNDNDDDDEDKDKRRIRRYPLPRRHGKTFRTLFFHHKDKVIELLDSFAHRQGKFAIRGSAHKMTWLLYGPPGTGKTSLVKAMAQYLQRHVVIINLAAIRNFNELQDWMHNPFVTVENKAIESEDSESDSSDFDNCDVCCFDADRAIYKQWRKEEKRRKGQRWLHRRNRERFTLTAKSVIYLLEDVDAVSVEDITSNKTINNVDANVMNTEKANLTESDPEQHTFASDQIPVERVKIKSKYEFGNCGKSPGGRKSHNGLSITDIVRVLTNPVAPEGRFVILTTNHIENVHPLLLQLSVVDDRIMMGYVNTSDAQKIIEHYYQCTLTQQQRHELLVIAERISKRVQDEFCSAKQRRMGVRESAQRDNLLSLLHTSSLSAQYNGFSPAVLEQMCAEEETVEDLLRKMRCKYFETDKRDYLEMF